MHSFFRSFIRLRPFQRVYEPLLTKNSKARISPIQATTMAGSMTAATAYALVSITTPSSSGAVPEDVADKKHHAKHGVGFINPWPSWKEFSGPGIAKDMIW